ncbi:MAG: DUF4870 domain-containing protein [Proteobacteria bacterium]|nr:DUF4870 domain-containing protein [Pseudomonadota bacterium]
MAENPQEKTMAMLCHLLALAGLVVPFGNILGPLIVWLMKKDTSELVNDQGKESLNFQISFTIYGFVAAILSLIVIGIPIAIALVVFWAVMVIMASIKANEGQRHRYPLNLRLIK